MRVQLAKIDQTRFLQLLLYTAGISAVVLGTLATLFLGALRGLLVFVVSVFVSVGFLFLLAVGLGYKPNRRDDRSD
ncbi:MAG: hypothetical protein Q7R93_00920 [bacterium]|nr:hypothetical protein [bacterium]